MELKEFVKSVLADLVQAVEETRENAVRDMQLASNKDNRTVEFDIAVTVEDKLGTSGKAGISILKIIEGGGNINKEVNNSTVSRIRFGVYVDSMTKKENADHQAQIERYNREGYNETI